MDSGTREALEDFKKRLERRFGPRLRAIYLFGSRARGDQRPDSDADVAVFLAGLSGDPWPLEREMIGEAVDILLDRDLDIVPWAFDEVSLSRPEIGRVPHIAQAVLREGIRI